MKKKSSTIKVTHECLDCGGSGIYSGFCEAKGTAVICLGCDGHGVQTSSFKPFKRLRRVRGISTVYNSRGRFIATGVGAVPEKSVSYSDFFKGKRP